MSEYRKTYPGGLFFVTLSVVGWIDVFERECYKEILADNLIHCQKNEGLELFAYVIMSSHLHMIASRGDDDLGELLGRFKSYTAKKILKLIEENPEESRKDWLLHLFRYFAKHKKQYDNYHFWQYTNHPVELFTAEVIDQKVDYIHQNPVSAGIVTEPQFYKWSSACPDSPVRVLEL